jgi:hypothetical protein
MSSEFRKQVEACYDGNISDELWQIVTNGDLWHLVKTVEDAVSVIRREVKSQDAEAKAQNLEAKAQKDAADLIRLNAEVQHLQQLVQQNIVERRKECFVRSVSCAAKDDNARGTFRTDQVGSKPCLGGFVCHPMFIEFVKASNFMVNETQERLTAVSLLTTDVGDVIEELQNFLGSTLTNGRKESALLSKDNQEEEAPQSAVAAEMLRFALEKLKEKQSSRNGTSGDPKIIVSDQYPIASNLKEGKICFLQSNSHKERKRKASGESHDDSASASSVQAALMRVDVLCWFVHTSEEMGTCCLACVEYKPKRGNLTDVIQREAQADMYASNIQILHEKPCIIIDIGGGNDVANWVTNVHGLAKRPREFLRHNEQHNWDKCPLYCGEGVPGIVRVAAGLLASLPYYPTRLDDYGVRLSPCVGLSGDKVFKAYDSTETREPNIDVIRSLVDEKAILWTTDDKTLKIVEMARRESDWNGELKVGVFVKILDKLAVLHSQNLVHGDIRLVNLLSSGYIVDFDFVGLERYPEGLNSLESERVRHPDVATAIRDQNIHEMIPEKKHDLHSMAVVLELFHPKAEWWEEAIVRVGKGELREAMLLLQDHEEETVTMA